MTHFAAADDLSENKFTDEQIDRFSIVVELFRGLGFDPTYIDLANSPGAVAHPTSRGNMVRLGGVLYGLGGDVLPKEIEKPELRPVLSLESTISHDRYRSYRIRRWLSKVAFQHGPGHRQRVLCSDRRPCIDGLDDHRRQRRS